LKLKLSFALLLTLLAIACTEASAQAENVPAGHPVYVFLKRMEVKRIITRYRDAIQPMSRRQVAEFLMTIQDQKSQLSNSERGWLQDYISEFQYDINGSTERIHSLIDSEEPSFGDALAKTFSNREKFFYAITDSGVSFFSNILFDADARAIKGDDLGDQHSEYLQLGFRARGTVMGHLGYYFQFSNAQFWGSRELLARDPLISQSYSLNTTNTQNFDFTEGYGRYDGGFFSVQLGRERVLWGYGFDQKLVISNNSRVFDFVRADAQYKAFKYTFIHGWLLGTRSTLYYRIPQDTTYSFSEPVINDKFFAAHRFELSFPRLFDIGFEEMYMYSNRSVDLAYLNPFVLLESVQRARGERDNGQWAFDLKTHFIPSLELHGTLLLDDIHIPGIFTNMWYDLNAWQVGAIWADPAGIRNITLFVDYTRIEPYVYSHERSRDNSFTNNGVMFGPPIGPNADSWAVKLEWLPLRNLYLSGTVVKTREGNNIYDSGGQLIKNVGGDPLVAHRGTDPETKIFLDGARTDAYHGRFLARFEPVNQLWLTATYDYDRAEDVSPSSTSTNNTFYFHVQWEF
jgi:hypothetical protein